MVTCRLMGGLGNQLFEIAATYAFSLRYNLECSFDLNNCYTPNQGNTSIKYKNNIFKNIKDIPPVGITKTYNEPKFSFDEIPCSDNMLLHGCFQSEKYFIDYQKEIIDLFELPSSIKLEATRYLLNIGVKIDKPLTSVHIRRGDYLKFNDFHITCPIEYYNKAINSIKDSQFIFISDDIEWVRENFKGENYFYSDLNDEILDLTIQTLCDNNIISNSSFSWWGAWLNQNPDKIIIAPSNWFGPSGHKDTQDIIPDNWLKYW